MLNKEQIVDDLGMENDFKDFTKQELEEIVDFIEAELMD